MIERSSSEDEDGVIGENPGRGTSRGRTQRRASRSRGLGRGSGLTTRTSSSNEEQEELVAQPSRSNIVQPPLAVARPNLSLAALTRRRIMVQLPLVSCHYHIMLFSTLLLY